MRTLIVIPARMASTRFPGKVLQEIAGKPMIEWVWDAALASNADDVIVASGDEPIIDYCRSRDTYYFPSEKEHINGSSRVGEVVANLQGVLPAYNCIINLQADEPLVTPQILNRMMRYMYMYPDTDIVTLYREMEYGHPDVYSQDVCKVALTATDRAMYFSRAPISSDQHIGIYGYNPKVLMHLNGCEITIRESVERLEQLRALEYGYNIDCLKIEEELIGVDNPSDLSRVAELLRRRESYKK